MDIAWSKLTVSRLSSLQPSHCIDDDVKIIKYYHNKIR